MKVRITVNIGNYQTVSLETNDNETLKGSIQELRGYADKIDNEDIIDLVNETFGEIEA